MVILDDTILALRCRHGAIHPITSVIRQLDGGEAKRAQAAGYAIGSMIADEALRFPGGQR
jgi:hypothetical protein